VSVARFTRFHSVQNQQKLQSFVKMKTLFTLLFVLSASFVHAQLSVEQSALQSTVLNAGDSMQRVFAFRLKATGSDVDFQSIEIDLGNSATIYTKVLKTMYLVDSHGSILAQADLNSSTVIKTGSDFMLTLGGFDYSLLQDATVTFTIEADVYSAIKADSQGSKSLMISAFGIQASNLTTGLDEFGPSASLSQSFVVQDVSAIPEPSTYAMILGATALGFVAWKRRKALPTSSVSAS
jgi:hypothetical protein